eukprot:364507-Chlamydomonas_euryale.AAC.6
MRPSVGSDFFAISLMPTILNDPWDNPSRPTPPAAYTKRTWAPGPWPQAPGLQDPELQDPGTILPDLPLLLLRRTPKRTSLERALPSCLASIACMYCMTTSLSAVWRGTSFRPLPACAGV